MRRQDIELFNKLFVALEDEQIFLDAHLSLSKMSVIVGTAIILSRPTEETAGAGTTRSRARARCMET